MAASAQEIDALREVLLDYFALSPTGQQYKAFDGLARFILTDKDQACFILRGAAGTGKTSMLRALVRVLEELEFNVVLMAPTGRAAKVISRRVGRYAGTVHRTIYNTETTAGGFAAFKPRVSDDPERTVYIVDEASMLSDQQGDKGGPILLRDLMRFIFDRPTRRKLLLVGDPAQLPPVGQSYSTALSPKALKQKYELTAGGIQLTEVKRQALESGILLNATTLREAIEAKATAPQSLNDLPALELSPDVERIDEAQEVVDRFTSLWDPDLPDRVVVLTYSNSLAVRINQGIRAQIHYEAQELTPGDVIMVVKNYYGLKRPGVPFLANGELGTVRRVHNDTRHELYGQTWCAVDLEFRDLSQQPIDLTATIPLSLLTRKSPNLEAHEQHKIWNERKRDIVAEREAQLAANPMLRLPKVDLKKDEYIGALQLKYGYAITTHKAQGGQWDHVFVVFEPYLTAQLLEEDYQAFLRWCYTAFTRASEKLYLFNCPFPLVKPE